MFQQRVSLLIVCSVIGVVPLSGCSKTPEQRDQGQAGATARGNAILCQGIPDLLLQPNVALPLLMAPKVQAELTLAPEQKQKLEAINHEFNGGQTAVDFENQKRARDRIQAVLLPKQIERANQIWLQLEPSAPAAS